MAQALPDVEPFHRFGRIMELMRSGHYDHLQMKSITPRDELDRMMAEVVMLASKMEFTEIELQV